GSSLVDPAEGPPPPWSTCSSSVRAVARRGTTGHRSASRCTRTTMDTPRAGCRGALVAVAARPRVRGCLWEDTDDVPVDVACRAVGASAARYRSARRGSDASGRLAQPGHAARMFRQAVGVTPTRYRQLSWQQATA